MVMMSFKICPTCKHKNPPELIECENCETDLQMVKVSLQEVEERIDVSLKDERKVENEGLKTNETSNSNRSLIYKYCPVCNSQNSAMATICKKCNNDLTLVIASVKTNTTSKKIKLVSDDGKCEIAIDSSYILVGRSISKYPYLATKGCVSRKHFKLTYFGGKLMIKNCDPVDPKKPVVTYINEKRLDDNERLELHDGDLIGLGGENTNKYEHAAYFKVIVE